MGSWTYPNLANVITFDGKVIRPLSHWPEGSFSVDEEAGEIKPHRYDPDAAWHRVGDNRDDEGTTEELDEADAQLEPGPSRAYGVRHGMLSAGPLILAVGNVPRRGGEPALVNQLLEAGGRLCNEAGSNLTCRLRPSTKKRAQRAGNPVKCPALRQPERATTEEGRTERDRRSL